MDERIRLDVSELSDKDKVPLPKYIHAAPSAPWPWMEFDEDKYEVKVLPPSLGASEWAQYPTSHFGNWTREQVERCRMFTICKDHYESRIHNVDVLKDGYFTKPDSEDETRKVASEPEARKFWDDLCYPVDRNLLVRALFVESITLDVLQILGARYDIEPFFFASSANWIPSRYQEDPRTGVGDHITVVLPFVRVANNPQITDREKVIDTQTPLVLSEQKMLLQDLLAIHMIRGVEISTIISYHQSSRFHKSTARHLQSLVRRTGDSVYWSKMYARSRDPTIVLLPYLWYALYAWDNVLEVLNTHLTKQLATIRETNDVEHSKLTRELHNLQAHLLYYKELLLDFFKSVQFVRDTLNPAMDAFAITREERDASQALMRHETDNLFAEMERLERQRKAQLDQVENAIKLVDSKNTQKLTRATLRDSAAMKQLSYLGILFLPASFLAGVFGMNVSDINPGTPKSIVTYVVSTVILTVITAWFIVALQEDSPFHPGGCSYVERALWPVFYGYHCMKLIMTRGEVLHRQRGSRYDSAV